MITIKTNDRELVAVSVPVGATDFELHGPLIKDRLLYYESDGYAVNKRIYCNGKIIGLLSDLTEQQAAEYVERTGAGGMWHYMNYMDIYEPFLGEPIKSLFTLLKYHGLNTSAPILLIEKVK